MNKALTASLEQKSSEDLFFMFRHDGAINFEQKIIAGKILNERGYDKTKLSKEREIIVESIIKELKTSDNSAYLVRNSKRKIKNDLFMKLAFLLVFSGLGMKDYLFNNAEFDFVYISIMLFIGIVFLVYHTVTYKKTLNTLINEAIKNNELLRFRLKLIESDWSF
ncbi:MAG: hypothetical protein RBR87_13300 [Bacteroidales bacterium]|nr:hypothetical protein [Bacteroidales bacterium]